MTALRLRSILTTSLFAFCLAAPTAWAQSYPVDEEFITYGAWEPSDGGVGGSVRTDAESGWAALSVDRFSSSTMNSIEFSYSFGLYDPEFVDSFKGLFGRDLSSRVSIVIDGVPHVATSAIMSANDDGGVGILIRFYDPSHETSPAVWENSCPVVAALANARRIQVTFPSPSGAEGYVLNGRGSTAALRDVC